LFANALTTSASIGTGCVRISSQNASDKVTRFRCPVCGGLDSGRNQSRMRSKKCNRPHSQTSAREVASLVPKKIVLAKIRRKPSARRR
jgi:hypothetical protein